MLVREITVRNSNQKYGTLSENRVFTTTKFVAHKVAQPSRAKSLFETLVANGGFPQGIYRGKLGSFRDKQGCEAIGNRKTPFYWGFRGFSLVARSGIEPLTHGFSVRCSTS